MIKLFLFALLFIILSEFNIFSETFEKSQLPISESLALSFPKIKATCFIITSKKAGIVLHEKNSSFKIHSGTFNNIVFIAAAALTEHSQMNEIMLMNDYAKKSGAKDSIFSEISPYSQENKTTLYDMCCIFENSLTLLKKKNVIKQKDNLDICFFKSQMSGVGCAFHYKNENNCEFSCVLYGLTTEDEGLLDAKAISIWLNQFFLYSASKKGDFFAKVPIFYGKINKFCFNFAEDHFLLMQRNCKNYVTKISRYRTMIQAPVKKTDQIGTVFYQTSIFQSYLPKVIETGINIEKSNRFKVFLDTIYYLVFGAPFEIKKHFSED